MFRYMMAAAFVLCVAAPAFAQDSEEIVVTGARLERYEELVLPAITMTRRADAVLANATVWSDSRDPAVRSREIRATLGDMARRARASDVTISLLQDDVLRPFTVDLAMRLLAYGGRADSGLVVVQLRTATRGADDTLDAARGRFTRFVESISEDGRASVEFDQVELQLTVGFLALSKRTNEVSDATEEANDNILEEKIRLQALFQIAKDRNNSLEKRQAAISEINKISPEYLGNIKLETINTLEASNAIITYLGSLQKKAEAESTFNLLVEKSKELVELKNELGDSPSLLDMLLGATTGGVSLTSKSDEVERLQKEIDELSFSYANLTSDQLENAVTDVLKTDKKSVISGNADAVEELATAFHFLNEEQKREINLATERIGRNIMGVGNLNPEIIRGSARAINDVTREQKLLNDEVAKENQLRAETLAMVAKQKQAAALLGETIGNVFSGMLATAEEQQKEFYKSALLGLLDYLERFLTAKIAEVFISQVASKGFAGIVTAGVLTGLMKASFNVVRNSITGFAEGGVIEDSNGVPIQRSNGDNRLVTVKTGEVILNERQQSDLKAGVGADIFRRLRVPGFATGGLVLGDGGMTSRAFEISLYDCGGRFRWNARAGSHRLH